MSPASVSTVPSKLYLHQVSIPNFANLAAYVLEVNVCQTIVDFNLRSDDPDQLEEYNHATLVAELRAHWQECK